MIIIKKPSSAERAQRLRQLRELTGLSRAAIERKYNISAATLRSWEDNLAGGLTEVGAKRIAFIFRKEKIDFSIEWLLEGIGAPPQKVIRSSLEREETEQYKYNSAVTLSDEVNFFQKINPDSVIYRIEDDAMLPFYMPGDYVGGIRMYGENLKEALHRDCIIETPTNKIFFRRLRQSTIEGCYNLVSINPDTKVERPFIYDTEIVAASPAIWIRK